METATSSRDHQRAWSATLTALRARLKPIAAYQLGMLLELVALTGLVVAQPLLDVLGRSPDFLLLREADNRDIVFLAIAITLLPPLLLWAIEALVGLPSRRVQRIVHLILVGGLLGLLGLEVAKKATPLRGPALVALGLLVGLVGALLYTRGRVVRLWIRALSPAPIAFLLLFLLVSPVAQLLKPVPSGAAELPVAAQSDGKRGPIVFVLMDEFPLTSILDQRGEIDERMYPNFARLAGQATWYRNATAVIGMTGWALPSMMTGRYPAEDRLPVVSQFPDNLFTLLNGSYGYKMRVFEGMSQLCPPSICPDAKKPEGDGGQGDGQADLMGFRGALRDSAGVWAQIVSPREASQDVFATLEEATVEADDDAGPPESADPEKRAEIVKGYKRGISFQRFLSAIRRPTTSDHRTMYFVHVLMPHQPWKHLPSGRTYPQRTLGDGQFAKGGVWVSEPWPVRSMHHRHLMQAAIADRMIGDLMDRLRDEGLYDESLLVVTADHGMSFIPGEPARISPADGTTAPTSMWVPLFIKSPGQRAPVVTDANWEHVDLLPTVAEIMGIEVPWTMEGVSWADPSATARQRSEKWFYTSPGNRRTYQGPANQAIALRGDTDRLLRPEDGYLGWFKFGPHADLVGRRVDDLTVAGGGGTARVIDLKDYRDIDLASNVVPAHVGGQLTETAPDIPQRPLVVAAINGVIGGVSETFASGDPSPTWFSAMIPDSLMRQGDNELQLFILDTTTGRQRLRPLTLTG